MNSTTYRSKNSQRQPLAGLAANCRAWLLVVIVCIVVSSPARACPFCTSLKPTLTQRRAASRVVALAEFSSPKEKDANSRRFRIHQVLTGQKLLSTDDRPSLEVAGSDSPGTLAIIMGSGPAKSSLRQLRWTATPVDELSYAYFARSPSLRRPAMERLAYFARYLEHRDALIAADAFQEFAHASYDEVVQVEKKLSAAKLRQWLVDDAVRPQRKGFYGLALGIVSEPAGAKTTNAEFLKALIEKPAGDFRAGFDGILAGYMVSRGPEGIELIRKRFLADPTAAVGDVRHAAAALRFYQQFGTSEHGKLVTIAMRELLDRPDMAAGVITDLARWKDWQSLERIAPLYRQKEYAQSEVRRAVIGFLLVCPKPAAATALADLRRFDPAGVAAAEKQLAVLGATDK
ncbi:MAG: hypothetical protein IID44_23685 [Planctomycetes bacterium]|nr:hypothetical protein [Planctomycetota bacterium]